MIICSFIRSSLVDKSANVRMDSTYRHELQHPQSDSPGDGAPSDSHGMRITAGVSIARDILFYIYGSDKGRQEMLFAYLLIKMCILSIA